MRTKNNIGKVLLIIVGLILCASLFAQETSFQTNTVAVNGQFVTYVTKTFVDQNRSTNGIVAVTTEMVTNWFSAEPQKQYGPAPTGTTKFTDPTDKRWYQAPPQVVKEQPTMVAEPAWAYVGSRVAYVVDPNPPIYRDDWYGGYAGPRVAHVIDPNPPIYRGYGGYGYPYGYGYRREYPVYSSRTYFSAGAGFTAVTGSHRWHRPCR